LKEFTGNKITIAQTWSTLS